jgi:hypothetical protein
LFIVQYHAPEFNRPMTTRSPDRPSRPKFHVYVLALALAVPACKKDEKTEADATKTSEGEKSDATPDAKAEGDAKGGIGELAGEAAGTAADSMSAAGALTRGSVLAHVMLPNPEALLGKIKQQAAPEAMGSFLDPKFIKEMGAMQLGARGEVLKNLQFDKPIACVLVDGTASPFPIACVLGYTGGADKLVEHMGTEGKQADPGGAKGHFVVEGQNLFIDALGDRVVVATDTDAIGKAKPYLEQNIIGRADKNISDVEIVAYVSAGMTRYEELLEPLLSSMGAPTPTASDNPIEKAVAEYVTGSSKDSVQRFKDMEQATLALGFHADGFTTRWAMFPVAGSEFEKEMQMASAGPVDLGFVEKLPNNSVMMAGVRFDGKIGEMKSIKALRDAVVGEYAKELGKDAATVNKAIDDFLAEETALYGEDVAAALAYEPGSLGGVVVQVPLDGGKSGRESWKAWSEQFTVDKVLGPEAAKKVTWSFKADAATIGGAPVDRWTLEPTKEALAEMEKESPETFKAIKAKWTSMAVTIDRAEVDGRAIFVITPTAGDKYMQAAIDAVGGKSALAEDRGYKAIAAKNAKVSALWAVDVKQGSDLLRQLLPPEDAAKIPPSLGNDLSDVWFSSSYGRAGSQTGEFSISQGFIDQLRALAN